MAFVVAIAFMIYAAGIDKKYVIAIIIITATNAILFHSIPILFYLL